MKSIMLFLRFYTVCCLLFLLGSSTLYAQKHDDFGGDDFEVQSAELQFFAYEKGLEPDGYLQKCLMTRTGAGELPFELVNTRVSPGAMVYEYRERINGFPVLDAVAKVSIPNREGASVLVANSFLPVEKITVETPFEGADAYFLLDADLLIAVKREEVLDDNGLAFLELRDERGEIVMRRLNGSGTGPATAVATVFQPNPITSAETVYGGPFVDNNDETNPFLDAELDTVFLELTFDSADSLYKLINGHVIITEHSPPVIPPTTSENDTFFFNRSDPEFEDVNAFYHITQFWKYLESIGYENDVDEVVEVDANALFGQDLSFFDVIGGQMRISFGTGGVDDAEDADVVIHEYGHAVSFSISPNTNSGTQRQAIEEGFCDYFATSYSRDINSHDYRKVFNWDGHNEFWDGRVAWTNRVYPNQLEMRIYGDAPMWSGALFHVENNLGRDVTHRLFLESLYSYVSFMDMEQAARLFMRADTLIEGGENIPYLAHIFAERGFIEKPVFPAPGDLVGIAANNLSGEREGDVIMMNSAGFTAGAAPVIFENIKGNRLSVVRVFDTNGRMVKQVNCSGGRQCSILPDELRKGFYIAEVLGENGAGITFKLIRL